MEASTRGGQAQINRDKAALVGRTTQSWWGNGGVRRGRREKREQGKDRHMKDGINERGLHSGEAFQRGGVEGRGIKEGRKWFRHREMETESVRGSVKRRNDRKRKRRKKLRGSGVSDVQKEHSAAVFSLVWPWWDYNTPAATAYHLHTFYILFYFLSSSDGLHLRVTCI